ncbi:hypothetical protein KCU93_g8446, partial [Aureobasidium melanogenum]
MSGLPPRPPSLPPRPRWISSNSNSNNNDNGVTGPTGHLRALVVGAPSMQRTSGGSSQRGWGGRTRGQWGAYFRAVQPHIDPVVRDIRTTLEKIESRRLVVLNVRHRLRKMFRLRAVSSKLAGSPPTSTSYTNYHLPLTTMAACMDMPAEKFTKPMQLFEQRDPRLHLHSKARYGDEPHLGQRIVRLKELEDIARIFEASVEWTPEERTQAGIDKLKILFEAPWPYVNDYPEHTGHIKKKSKKTPLQSSSRAPSTNKIEPDEKYHSERKARQYEELLAQQRRIQAQMAMIDPETRREVDRHQRLKQDIPKSSSMPACQLIQHLRFGKLCD